VSDSNLEVTRQPQEIITKPPKIIIELLKSEHERKEFDCGEETLNRYLQQYASQHQKKNFGRVYIARQVDGNEVKGYYTLANASVEFQSVPKAKGLPKEYPIPVILLARLAIDKSMQGQGLGGVLLIDALKQSVKVSEISAVYAVIVDAIDEKAKAFYLRYRFEESLDDPLRLFLPMQDIKKVLG
jgi:GNAT superfamily N-acetyltransferase